MASKSTPRIYLLEGRFTDEFGDHSFNVEGNGDGRYLLLVDDIYFSEIELDEKNRWIENGSHTQRATIIGAMITKILSLKAGEKENPDKPE